MRRVVTDDLDALLDVLPLPIREPLYQQPDHSALLEVILDLGRLPEARFLHRELVLNSKEVSQADIDYVVSHIGEFSGDNRAGINHTLHRISAIRNRNGYIIGLTCRVGRAVFGTVGMIQDLIESGNNVLLLGRPGIGKTTMLREVARVLADEFKKRVIVIDTSNEIAGDGDIPHPAIGHARRMQVAAPAEQHSVMIEAVENHMPEVIIIDEIGTELEAKAARTIAERGVQLVGTAHGNTLENLIMNPTLSDLIGGVQTVTLGDEEARRRHTQKSILERKAPPTFDMVVEIVDYYKVTVHPNVTEAVDALLHGQPPKAEVRSMDEDGEVKREAITSPLTWESREEEKQPEKTLRFYLFGANRSRLEQTAREGRRELRIVADLRQADIFLTTRSYYRRKPQKIRDAEALGIPIYVLKSNNAAQMKHCLDALYPREAQSTYVHNLQRILAGRRGFNPGSRGVEPGGKRKSR
ncbi:MAG: single-stranded DNA-binding protein [Chloroflexi bacterium RBG_13_51_36]|nr:MAG: single-stranded DNA-binding protein [Chloroflexi bacterium RBG_13_51_36]